MSNISPYRDKRQEFFKDKFEKAQDYTNYLANSEQRYSLKWQEFESKILLPERAKQILNSFTRKINILVLSGIWCGDCSRQGPMFRLIEKNCPLLQFKFIDNKEHADLAEELRINGAGKVPVVVALSEDFFEMSRFGDRHLSVYRNKLQNELGAACDPGILPPHQEDLTVEFLEWVSFFERVQIMLRLSPMLRRRYND